MANEPQEHQVGLGVDRSGGPVVDPTKNVLDLVNSSIKRIDDVALVQAHLYDEKISRLSDAVVHAKEVIEIRAEHQLAMDTLESKRLDSTRQYDQLAVQTAAARSDQAITALATQAATTAETLRSAVNTSATNLATQLDRTVTAITERIAALEKSSYVGAGKQAVVDPQMERLAHLVEQLASATSTSSGKNAGIELSWGVILAIVGLVFAGMALFYRANGSSTVPTVTPQVVYVPAPQGTPPNSK